MTKGDAKEWARRYVGRHPFLFYNFYRLKPSYRDLLVDRRTQIVIVGFPRSGNTFAVVAFQQAQRESVRVAHHLHMPAQVIRAAQWGIPILLLARKPTDAALSWVVREPGVSIRQALKHYISFYEKAAEYHDALVVGFFEEVIRDYGTVLERVNAKFGTGFSSFVHSEENVKMRLRPYRRGAPRQARRQAGREGDRAPLGCQSRAERRTKEGAGSPGGKEAHRQGRSRLRELRAYGGPGVL